MKQTRSKQLWLMLAVAMCICILALMGAGSLSKADNAGQMYTYSAAASFVCDAMVRSPHTKETRMRNRSLYRQRSTAGQ